MDLTEVTQARADAEQAERDAEHARLVYYRAVAALVDVHGATEVARALKLSRGRIYQLTAKARDA